MPRDRPPRIWETLKRALSGAEPRPQPPPNAAAAPTPAKLPAVAPERESLVSAPPFLPDSEGPDPPVSHAVEPPRASAPADPPAPPAVSVAPLDAADPAQSPDGPRLARGLASFSRSNADREKKFAHLLHDDGPGGKKKPPA